MDAPAAIVRSSIRPSENVPVTTLVPSSSREAREALGSLSVPRDPSWVHVSHLKAIQVHNDYKKIETFSSIEASLRAVPSSSNELGEALRGFLVSRPLFWKPNFFCVSSQVLNC
jgi:hypothetical protein